MNSQGPFDPRREAPLLSAFVDGELDPADVVRIEAHLAEETPASEATRREIDKLRRLKTLAGAMRLKDAPPEEWEAFWENVYNRGERSLGWILLSLGLAIVGVWASYQLLAALVGARDLPVLVKAGILGAAAGFMILLVSVLRERIYKRKRTRYRDIIR